MALTSFRHSLQLATDNVLRNKFLTLATVSVMALILFIFNLILSVNLVAQQAMQDLKEKVDLTLYLNDEVDSLVINQLIPELEGFSEILSVTYISKEEALESVLSDYQDEIDPFSNYDLDNPLPASLQIITQNPEDHASILAYLEQANYGNLFIEVDSNADNQQIVDDLLEVTQFSEKLLLGIILMFIGGSIMIIANAIQITMFHRKREIQIMRLVGAHLNFIRSPFIMEGAFYGLSSVLISLVLFWTFSKTISLSEISFLSENIRYGWLFAIQIVISTLLGMASSTLSINHHLKRKLL